VPHELDLIFTLTGGLTAALVLGFLTQKLRLSPIVGYLLAGILVGPFTPGYVADQAIATQCAEIGVILLMFGVGLHFHLKDLLAVRSIALPGALIQITAATALGAGVTHFFDWTWTAGLLFGMAISVASTVVLTRVLADNRALHTPTGHIAIGWLIVEDLFTILVLVLLPAFFGAGPDAQHGTSGGLGFFTTAALALLKLLLLVGFALLAGQKLIPLLLGYIAETRSRELFTLAVLVLALGIAVGAAKLFGASMALGAFLAGMIVGQSDYSARAASEALPMRDAFAVLFFVSVGMLFNPAAVTHGWPLMLATLGIILVGKPAAALLYALLMKRPLRSALAIAVALGQIGEFSFILATLGSTMGLLPPEALNTLVVASVFSITLNPLLYQGIEPLARWLDRHKWVPDLTPPEVESPAISQEDSPPVLLIGYGPIGKTLAGILRDNGIGLSVVEMNLETVKQLQEAGIHAVYGDALQTDILRKAGIEKARGLILTASEIPAAGIIQTARELNPRLHILTRASYLKDSRELRKAGADAVFASEGEIALSMSAYLLEELGATDEQIARERERIRKRLF
jgi:CPA2 family monovalent cation:H+ antiporter-2